MSQILDIALDYLSSEVAPKAEEIDHDRAALGQALQGLCARNLMALRRPKEFGGPNLPELEFRQFQVAVARTSGSLAFLQTQHQSAGSMIANGDNPDLKSRYLPLMADGKKLVGIGFSQLRRPGPPILTATESERHYVLNGQVPWVTGLGFYPEFLVGATCEDGSAVFGVIPFANGDGIEVGEVMRLAAMESPQTVSVSLKNLALPKENVCFVKPAGWIHQNDQINITIQGFFAIGCALAGCDVVRSALEKKPNSVTSRVLSALENEVSDCQEAMIQAQSRSTDEVTTQEKLDMRAWAIELAVRCALAGIVATGGSANMANSRAQRVYREALVYSVSAQTTPIMEATLERLVSRTR